MMFYMRLALRLGRSLDELLRTVSSAELTHWRAFDSLEPIGDWRMDLGFGVVASTIANANRSRDTDPFKPIDFMPLAEKPKEESLAEKIKRHLMNVSGHRAKRKG